MTFKILFDEKHEASEILFQESRAANINELPFSKHQNRSKGQVMMASRSKMGVKGVHMR